MKYGYYPGCCMHSTAPEYEESLFAVCERLDIELEEVRGWICCGTSPAHSTSRLLSLALPLENLRLAEAMELAEVVAPCASCFARLKVARHESNTDPELAEQLSEVLDAPVPTKIEVLHLSGSSRPSRACATTAASSPGPRTPCNSMTASTR